MSYNFTALSTQIGKTLDHIKTDVGTLRTGRASVSLLDPVSVEAYGTRMKLQEIASVTAPDATLLVISPWDKSLVGAIEKAVQIANLNLNPVVDGQIVRINIPPLTTETREAMVKQLHQKLESGRVMLRNLRSDAKHDIEKQKGQQGVSEDDIEHDLKTLEDKLQQALDQLETMGQTKEKELMTI